MSIKDFRKDNKKFLNRAKHSAIIDKSNLTNEMANQPSEVYFYGRLKADAEYLKDKAKSKIEIIEAIVDKAIRKKAKKKPTEAQVTKKIGSNKNVVEAKNKYLIAKLRFNHCVAAYNAVVAKGDQLTNIGHMHRKEMDIKSVRQKIKAINKNAERGDY